LTALPLPPYARQFHATTLRLLGFDHTRLTYHYSGRDFRLTDEQDAIVRGLLA
jgi:hypothetical protein